METHDLRESNVFEGLDEDQVARITAVGRPRGLLAGERLFILGDGADRLYMVAKGSVDLCFPFSFRGVVKDVCVETLGAGGAFGWSALVRPYRFTLSARAAVDSEVAAFPRGDLLEVFEGDPRTGYVFMKRIAEVVGNRLHKMQALWARELQRAVTQMLEGGPEIASAREKKA